MNKTLQNKTFSLFILGVAILSLALVSLAQTAMAQGNPKLVDDPSKEVVVTYPEERMHYDVGDRMTVKWTSTKDTTFNVNLNPIRDSKNDDRTQVIVGRNMRFHGNFVYSFNIPEGLKGKYRVQVIRTSDFERDSANLPIHIK